jgi:hypothetical protein
MLGRPTPLRSRAFMRWCYCAVCARVKLPEQVAAIASKVRGTSRRWVEGCVCVVDQGDGELQDLLVQGYRI